MKSDKADKMLTALGAVLEQEKVGPVDILVCGAMALAMQGLIERRTRDIDGLAKVVRRGEALTLRKPLMSRKFTDAVERVGIAYGEGQFWFSTAAIILHDDTKLPRGMAERALVRAYGPNLTVRFCSRTDMIYLKIWAAIKRGAVDIQDLKQMKPTAEEAENAAAWCLAQDPEAGPELARVLEELGHGELAKRFS